MKLHKSEKLLYILLVCIWFLGICLENRSTFPFGVTLAAMIVKEICFFVFLTYTFLKFLDKHIGNKKFVFVSVCISVFSFILSGAQSVLYELQNPDSFLIPIFPVFIFALLLWAFIFDKKENKKSIKTPKNIAILMVLIIFTLLYLAINIIGVIDLCLAL